jgi:hypothetical protein
MKGRRRIRTRVTKGRVLVEWKMSFEVCVCLELEELGVDRSDATRFGDYAN